MSQCCNALKSSKDLQSGAAANALSHTYSVNAMMFWAPTRAEHRRWNCRSVRQILYATLLLLAY